MTLAIFDLDNTLIAGDSDYLWGKFMIDKKIVDEKSFNDKNEQFYLDYQQGSLDIFAYQKFIMKPLIGKDFGQLKQWHSSFMQEYIVPIVLPKAKDLVDKHRKQEHTLLIITATNSFITSPIAKLYGIENLIATEPEITDGTFTGNVQGVPSFREGKVIRLKEWLKNNKKDLAGSYFYSDSHNDIPLLDIVTIPIAIDADSTLKKYAQKNNWQQLSLR